MLVCLSVPTLEVSPFFFFVYFFFVVVFFLLLSDGGEKKYLDILYLILQILITSSASYKNTLFLAQKINPVATFMLKTISVSTSLQRKMIIRKGLCTRASAIELLLGYKILKHLIVS